MYCVAVTSLGVLTYAYNKNIPSVCTYIHLLGLYVNIACVLWRILTLSVKGNKTIGLSP